MISIDKKTVLRIILIGLVIAPSYIYPITLEKLPKEIKELIVHHTIIQSKTAQQAQQKIAELQDISRSWHALLRHEIYAYKQYQQIKNKQQAQKNYISEAFAQRKKNEKQKIHEIIKRINQLPPDQYQNIFNTPKPAELDHFTHNHYDWLQAAKILEPLLIAYIETGDFSLDCFDAFFALYSISKGTTTKDPLHIYDYTLFEKLSKTLISYYINTSCIKDTAKKNRTSELINKLQSYGLLYTNFNPSLIHEVWTSTVKAFLLRASCTQQDITFLNKTLHLKKQLSFKLLHTLATEYRYNKALFNIKVVCICSAMAIAATVPLYKWQSIFLKLAPEGQQAIIKVIFFLYWPLINKLFVPPIETITAYTRYKKSDQYILLKNLKTRFSL